MDAKQVTGQLWIDNPELYAERQGRHIEFYQNTMKIDQLIDVVKSYELAVEKYRKFLMKHHLGSTKCVVCGWSG